MPDFQLKTCEKSHRASDNRYLRLHGVLHIATYFVKSCRVKIYLDQLQGFVGLLISWKELRRGGGRGTLTKLWRSGSVDEVLGQFAFVPVVLGQQLSELQSILLVSALLLLLGHVPIESIAGNKTIGV